MPGFRFSRVVKTNKPTLKYEKQNCVHECQWPNSIVLITFTRGHAPVILGHKNTKKRIINYINIVYLKHRENIHKIHKKVFRTP